MDCRRPNPRSSPKRRKCPQDTCSVSQTLSVSVSFLYHQFYFSSFVTCRVPFTVDTFLSSLSPLLSLLSSCSSFCIFCIIYIFSHFKCSLCLKQTKKIYKIIIKLLLIKSFLHIFILRSEYHFPPKEDINEHV